MNVRENTLEALGEAVLLGVAGVELDVRRSLDGVLVVHHDAVSEFLVIAESPARDLPGYVPRLEEALATCSSVVVNVEIKNAPDEPGYDGSGTLVREVLACVRNARSSAVISCFDLATCDEIRRGDSSIDVAWLSYKGTLDDDLETAREHGFNALNPHLSMVKSSAQSRAEELGLALNVWTVNEARDLAAMGNLGVASVITDEPQLALEVLAASPERRVGDDAG